VIKRRDTDQSGEGEIKVFRPAPEGRKRGGIRRNRTSSIPSGTNIDKSFGPITNSSHRALWAEYKTHAEHA